MATEPLYTKRRNACLHLQLLTDQVTARVMKNWKADILAFDKGENHIIKLADTLTEGIIKQFPEKFK